MKPKLLHILYSGLGGHGSDFFSAITADNTNEFSHVALFAGIESVREEYKKKCNQLNVEWNYVQKKKGLDFSYYKKVFNQMKKVNPDFIILYGSGLMLPAITYKTFKTKKSKIIKRETQANHLKRPMDWFDTICALLFADRIIYLTHTYRDEIKKKFKLLFNSQKVSIIPNGIDTLFYSQTPKAKTNADSTILIGMQSRLVPIKDHKTLIHAFALINETHFAGKVKLLIAGDGETLGELQQLVFELSITDKVEFLGMLDEIELVQFLNELDIYVHASYGETMSTAILQAMACKLPIIASNVLGINNMLTDKETALLVPLEDVQSLFKAIISLINDPVLKKLISENAYKDCVLKYSNTHSWSLFKKEILLLAN